jgi:dihydrodipicolinate synthase/N-acetylneuraminate lyase
MPKLHGAIAAAVTPLRSGGRHLDEESVEPLMRFLSSGGIDGVLACGTTGEGVLLTLAERRRMAELVAMARPPGFQLAVHAGAQNTADTVALAAHALDVGADAVAVIAPPYFPLDDEEIYRHLRAAASACDPLAFYVYEFKGRSGYAIPPDVIARLRDDLPNVAGMKVSDTPFSQVEPYILDELELFVGSEPLVIEGIERGAKGAVSGLATAFPDVVASLVHMMDPGSHARVVELRKILQDLPFHAALKEVLVARGVLLHADVRAPLRALTDEERALVRAQLL